MNETILELESWVERYRQALQEIADADASSHHVHHLTTIAQSALDGEPTTADMFNKKGWTTKQAMNKVNRLIEQVGLYLNVVKENR